MNKISKSKDNAVIFGVLGGLGEYFNVDPVLIRVLVVVVAFMSGGFPVIVLYLLLALIMPEEPKDGPKRRPRRQRGDYQHHRKNYNHSEKKEVKNVEEDDWSDF